MVYRNNVTRIIMRYFQFNICILLIFSFLFVGCSDNEKDRTGDVSAIQDEQVPDYSLMEVTHYHYKDGLLRMAITFEEGKFYSDTGELNIDKCTYIYYDINETMVSRGRSKEAKIFDNQSLIIAENDVVIISEVNGAVLETDYLEWHGREEQFVTERPVTITRPNGDMISGIGMIADITLRYITIKKDVTGSFSDTQ